ncbi:bromodomain-containing protein DDB_G0280777-like [Rhopilema esculentum]|uniref:bromodomain-containing protein DDB_G0280777-like n=1 Tax=Rhopilema esculentum TaxID=499914 RepID=UPI0031DCF70D
MNLDDWSVREKLVLACCVVRSGDQNWASVSRTIKPICEAVHSRPTEWFSQKNCANQYGSLLEGTSTKKRKRTSSESGLNETPMEQIIRKLSFERIDELKKTIQTDRLKYKKLKSDIEKIRCGKVDDQLQKIWNEFHSGKNLPIESFIPDDNPIFHLTMEGHYPDGGDATMGSSSTSALHQQQQSSALYQRSKSQRQPKATKKFESWMTQLKQQQARHQQSHSGSLHSSPHGQGSAPVSQGASEPSSSTDASQCHGVRPQSFFPQQQFPNQLPYQQQQQQNFHQEQQILLQQHQQQQMQQSKQFLQQQQPQHQQSHQRQGFPQISPRLSSSSDHQTSTTVNEPGSVLSHFFRFDQAICLYKQGFPQISPRLSSSSDHQTSTTVNEPGSVLSTLLSVPPSEIKAAAAMQQQKIIGDHLVVKETAGSSGGPKDGHSSASQQTPIVTSASVTAPTLSKLLETSFEQSAIPKSQSHRRMSASLMDDRQDSDNRVIKQETKEGNQSSQLYTGTFQSQKVSPSSQTKIPDSSPTGKISKKSTPDSSRTTPIEPLRIKVEDEDYFPDNEGMATPDSSQPSPRARIKKTKGKRGARRKHPQQILLKNLESLQDSEDTGSVDELASERDETESEVASVSDVKDMSDTEQEDGDEGGYAKMSDEAREQSMLRRSRGRNSSSNLSGGMVLSPNSPTLSVGSNDENFQAQKNWRKSVMLVWKSFASHKYANVFMHPVTNDEAPGYHSIIKRPMDLSTIKKNIENGVIRCTSDFHRDVMLMFQNALMYNREDHDVHRMAEEMREEAMELIQSFVATQLHLLVQSADRDMMHLRGHRSDDEKGESRRSKSHGRGSHKV